MTLAALPQLPTELISQITPYLVNGSFGSYSSILDDLYSLRLTCHELNSKSLFDFGKAAFSTLIVDFSLRSLDRFYAISQHPDFRKAVKQIYFANDVSQPISLGIVEDEPDSDLKEQVEWILRAGLERIFVGLSNLRKVFVMTPFAAPYFRYRQIDNLRSSDDLLQSAGTQAVYDTKSRIFEERWTVTANALYPLLLDVIEITGSGMEGIEIQDVGVGLDWRFHYLNAFGICMHSFHPRRKGLVHLRELRLVVHATDNDCTCGEPPLEAEYESQTPLYWALKNLPQLTILKLSFTNLRTPNDHRRLEIFRSLSTLHFPCLTAFGLKQALAEDKTLEEFLLRHKETLQLLLFDNVTLSYGCSWWSILTTLLNHHVHKLNEFEIICPYEDLRRVCIPYEDRYGWRAFITSPMMEEKLQTILSIMQYRNW